MEADYSQLLLPRELWQLICSYLTRRSLRTLAIINKSLHAVAVHEQLHRPKFRLTDNTLNILVAGPPSSGKSLLVSTLVHEPNTRDNNEHVVFTRSLALTGTKSRVGRVRHLTFFDVKAGRKQVLPVQLLTYAAMSELLLLVVNAHELSTRAAQYENTMKFLRAQLLSVMFAMSARDIVVALNLQHTSAVQGAEEFTEARQQLTRVINDTCDTLPAWYPPSDRQWHVVYVPVNIKLGFNLTPVNQRFTWYQGADLLTELAENQLRNYFDEDIWSRLVNAPLNFPLISAMKVSGVGTVAGGIMLSGTVRYRDSLLIGPLTRFPGDVLSVETNRDRPSNDALLPGDVAGINLRFTTLKELVPKHGYLTGRHVTPARQVFAFRITVHELTQRRLVLHQCYHVFYGTARFVCIVAWRYSADSNEHVIMVPLTHYPVTCRVQSDVQKNWSGKVLVVINGTCAALGRIDHVMHGPDPYSVVTGADAKDNALDPNVVYLAQYAQLINQPDPLFSVHEQSLKEQFVEHVKHSGIKAILLNRRK